MDTLNDVWKAVLSICRTKVSEVMYNMWLSPLELVKFENDTVVFCINTDFKKTIIQDKFGDVLRESFEEVMGFPVDIDIIVSEISAGSKPVPAAEKTDDAEEAEEAEEEKTPTGYEAYTFDNFIVGKSNNFAYSICVGVAQNPGNYSNPLLIYGRSGLGKTHLMLATLNEIKKNHPDYVIIYTTGENFMNEMVESIARKNPSAFRNKYRNIDVLLMDDIQFIQRGEGVQEEFFHTFDALYQKNKQIILTSDVPPRNMEILDERLRTRFEMGITADVTPPDFDTRRAIIIRKGQQLAMPLADPIVDYIAQKIKNNIRQIEGIVKKIAAMTNAYGRTLTLDDIKIIIRDVTSESQPVAVTVENVIDYVSKAFGVTAADIKSDKRQSKINTARQVAMYVLKEVTDLTLQEIGEYFKKTHATVIHALTTVAQKMQDTPNVRTIATGAIQEFQEKQ